MRRRAHRRAVVARRSGELPLADFAEAFLREREEDLVLRREVAVDRAGLYSTLAAMLRMETCAYPSAMNSSRQRRGWRAAWFRGRVAGVLLGHDPVVRPVRKDRPYT
jgi:hypothetical protein